MVYQDDSAPAHRSKDVVQFKNEAGLRSLEWAGNSPDLNPVENLWKILKDGVSKKKPRTKTELISAIIKVWTHEISNDVLRDLSESMPKRIKAVLKAKG